MTILRLADNLPDAPKASSEVIDSFSLIVCEKSYRTENGLWIISGTFNEMNQTVQQFGEEKVVWMVPPLHIYFRMQSIDEKSLEVLFVYRIISANESARDCAKPVAHGKINIEKRGHYSADHGIPLPPIMMEVQPKP